MYAQVSATERLRLIMLFALRYERDGRAQINQLLTMAGADSARSTVRRPLAFRGARMLMSDPLSPGHCQWPPCHGK